MPTVIADSSVLITLAAAENFDLLKAFYTSVLIPPEVWKEVCSDQKPYGSTEVATARADGWLAVRSPKDLRQVDQFRLDAGEAEAIALALEISEPFLLIDDARARRAAQSLRLAFTGTLGVLVRAKFEGRIAALRPTLEWLKRRTKFRLSASIHDAVLRQAGE